jgi:tRNA (guanine37-N1)-methyltransferase
MKRAIDKGLVEVHFIIYGTTQPTTKKVLMITPLWRWCRMVMTVQPIDACITHLKAERTYDEIIYMSP